MEREREVVEKEIWESEVKGKKKKGLVFIKQISSFEETKSS